MHVSIVKFESQIYKNEPQPQYMTKKVFIFLCKEMGEAKPQLFAVGGVVHVCACLLDAQTEVEQVVW